jgi:hypothetical protein
VDDILLALFRVVWQIYLTAVRVVYILISNAGNSGGGLHKHWELYFNRAQHPRIQGGFIWDWVDQGEYLLIVCTVLET